MNISSHVISAWNVKGLDHTYVVSTEGDNWGCNGRCVGGKKICEGVANLPLARCIAGPNGMANIDYGVNGVCHQISNRILWSAKLRVDSVRPKSPSIMFTYTVWGIYGDKKDSPDWVGLDDCESKLGIS